MTPDGQALSRHERWARFRHAVVGELLAAPPKPGELQSALRELAKKSYAHPITGRPARFGFSTIERWYYQALSANDPVAMLRRRVRRDAGHCRVMTPALIEALIDQYQAHPCWSYQLHHENVAALCRKHPELGPCPSYPTLRRYMKSRGLFRQRRRSDAKAARSRREIRSFEKEHIHGLWHADFHSGNRKVLLPDGQYVTPKLLCFLDDCSRMCCHLQWYLSETAEVFVHGLIQAILKRGLPRSLMTDGGSGMQATETTEGLARLGIHHATTLPESPWQNGKQENFFAQVEGRLVSMLEGVPVLDLGLLNDATQAWAELDYNRRRHSEIRCAPVERFALGPDVGRPSPSPDALRHAFCQQVRRKQRRSDGTLTVSGVRFEVPSRFRHFERVTLRLASWDLSRVTLVDPRTGAALDRLYPLDRHKNADGRRRVIGPAETPAEPPAPSGMAPRLAELLVEYAATGLPPAYLPLAQTPNDEESTDA